MPFPQTPRVIYRKNPLDRVICQLRFPPILKIDAEVPAEFQDRIRHEFPGFVEKSEWMKLEVAGIAEEEIPPEVLRDVRESTRAKNYEFSSEDNQWKVNLTRTFVALSTRDYHRWEQFKERLAGPLAALVDVYAPDHFSRIGLRYIDVITRSVLGLGETGWDELLKPYVLGILGAPDAGQFVQSFESLYEIRLPDEESIVRIITRFGKPEEAEEISFVIDSDFHTSKRTEVDAAGAKLDFFNSRSSRLIRWAITDRLHEAMEPHLL